ncbi:MAG: hypothetical protein ACI4ES_02125 [Roseburia sp.]
MAFPFLGLFLLFIFILTYQIKKNDKKQKESEENFWNREAEANHVRRQDISGLSYITIPFEKFPINLSDDEELKSYEADLQALSEKKILNLTGISNTDLKLQYGPANLPELSEYDQNYTKLAQTLVQYAKCLIHNGYEKEAVPVLEFAIETGSDISSTYTILADYYKKTGNTDGMNHLFDAAEHLTSLMKQPILDKLNHIAQSACP